MDEMYHVGMAEMRTVEPPDKLVCFGIGSCLCIVLYDPSQRLGGVVHSMLPWPPGGQEPPAAESARYSGSGIVLLVETLLARGAVLERLYARLVGGATMFHFPKREGVTAELSLGDRNLKAAREVLQKLSVTITAEESGGSVGRYLEFDPADGSLLVRTAGQERRWL